ncbi:SH3 domain-containing protein [Roseomonas sp. SSH11]|uniref:SH3 domain-containing protein n=1 Tax=Pararoseomonas baculiformis TaxID=2820812 RepID=A0ABS4ABD9_9PROT|nr:SH3 domain-containing protein [Pararoseomonas baculiformis]MBP0444321.1 SH3 domain-containing protein [Pararoseomonas baculiformis]
MRKGFLLAGLLALGGCFEDAAPNGQASAQRDDPLGQVRLAAEGKLRDIARDPENMRFRAVEVHKQSIPDTYAVCGQATLAGGAVFLPFVSVVSATNGGLEVEQHVARNNVEATRVYVELVGRCFDGGGPQARANGTPMAQLPPPLPNGLPVLDQIRPEPPKVPELVTAVSTEPRPVASSTLVMRQNGNVRSSPNGGGAVLRVARSGSVLNVFGTAPGGWYQVGDTEPEGWVHRTVGSPQPSAMASAQ